VNESHLGKDFASEIRDRITTDLRERKKACSQSGSKSEESWIKKKGDRSTGKKTAENTRMLNRVSSNTRK